MFFKALQFEGGKILLNSDVKPLQTGITRAESKKLFMQRKLQMQKYARVILKKNLNQLFLLVI